MMNKYAEILRIKDLMFNDNFKFNVYGDVSQNPGVHISICDDGGSEIGYSNLLNFNDSHNLDSDLPMLLGNNCGDFNNDNTVYLYDLGVLEDYRGMGLSKKLMEKCHELSMDMGVDYVVLITSCDNDIAQKLYKGCDYKVHTTNGVKDLFYKKL